MGAMLNKTRPVTRPVTTFVTPFSLSIPHAHGSQGRSRFTGKLSRALAKHRAVQLHEITRAELPPNTRGRDELPDDQSDDQNTAIPKKHQPQQQSEQKTDASLGDILDPTAMEEMDQLASQWIGTDLSRWEWYERLKSKREKLSSMISENEAQIDEDLEELRSTLMEVDEAFGTNMLDSESEITAFGWGSLVAITLFYVSIGYAIVHSVIYAVTTFVHANSFP